MYQGKNPTALQSREWLINALLELMKTENFAQITVGQICKKADLSRQTFYNLFGSKEDILHNYLKQQYELQFETLCHKDSLSINHIVEAFSDVITENKEVLRLIIDNHLEGILTAELSECIKLFAEHFAVKTDDDATLPYGIAFLSGALAQTLVFWLKQDNPISADEISKLLEAFFSGEYFKI